MSVRRDETNLSGSKPNPLTLVGLVILNIAMQLANASLIKHASGLGIGTKHLFGIAVILTVVIGLSFGRFLVWGAMHKRYPVSIAYPATALFFPCLVAIAAAFGERISVVQISGASLVTAGVLLLLLPSRAGQDESLA